jgi:thiol-disulfide isomerase/thioredoxin
MATSRRRLLAYTGVAAAAAATGALLAPVVLQRNSGAATLLATVFPDLDGQARRLLDWKGQITVTNFWATWCEPCREEMPLLARVRQNYSPKGVEIVGIGIDHVDKLRDFAAKYAIPYPLLVGDMRALDVMRELGNRAGALPYTVVLDRSGALVAQRLGALKPGELEAVLDRILR